jgi:hypothetical protein
MVGYEDDATERALRRRVPPAANAAWPGAAASRLPLVQGLVFPRGGRDGGTKLQGALLLDEQRRSRAEGELAAQLRAFLDRGDAEEADAATLARRSACWEVRARGPVSRRGGPDVPNKARCQGVRSAGGRGIGLMTLWGYVRSRHAGRRSFVAWRDAR